METITKIEIIIEGVFPSESSAQSYFTRAGFSSDQVKSTKTPGVFRVHSEGIVDEAGMKVLQELGARKKK